MSDFDFGAFLGVARALASLDDEASKRSAISRAYYAGYHGAKRSLGTIAGQQLRDHDREHYRFWTAVRTDRDLRARCSIDRLAQISILGNELRRRRVWADYDVGTSEDGTIDRVLVYVFKSIETLVDEVTLARTEAEARTEE